MEPRSCITRSPEEGEDVIKAIEKFIEEGHKSVMSPQLKNGRNFNSDVDLLQILSSDLDKNSIKKTRRPVKIKTAFISPNRKISHENNSEDKIMKPATPSRKRRKSEENDPKSKTVCTKDRKKRRGRPRKYHFAQVEDYKEPTFEICKNFSSVERNTCKILTQMRHKHKARVFTVPILVDSNNIRNITIKSEIIDLTYEEHEVLMLDLKFAKECSFEFAETFDSDIAYATPTEEPDLANVTIEVPVTRFNCDDVCVDLTQGEEEAPSAVSEKECATKLLPMIFKSHQILLVSKKLEDALHELEKCVHPDNSAETYERVFKLLSQHTACWRTDLLNTLSTIFVRNLNVKRFLDIIASKLQSLYQVAVAPSCVACYLMTMLSPNGDYVGEGFAGDLQTQLEEHLRVFFLKQERQDVFTAAQLEELRKQIAQYWVVVARQEELMSGYYGLAFSKTHQDRFSYSGFGSFPEMDKEFKAVLLTHQESVMFSHDTKFHTVINVDD